MTAQRSVLSSPFKLGGRTLQNRVAMAPMTRARATADGTVGEMVATYYRQRSTAGLIISEGINISAQAIGSPGTPGLYATAQIESWKAVTDAVHDAGGTIFAQLWHTGRVGHSTDRGGALPVAPSPIAIAGQQHFTSQGPKDYETPAELSTADVKAVVEDYRRAAKAALEAGFDGVELHAAFGYLPNQFLVDSANQRTDEYGGSIENRSRFILEVMAALVEAVGPDKVGIKLSQGIPYNSISDTNPPALFAYLISELDRLPLAYLHLMQPFLSIDGEGGTPEEALASIRTVYRGTIMVNGGYDAQSAEAVLESGAAQLVSFGALYVANPDLPERFATDADMNAPDRATFYTGGAKGYIDYPAMAAPTLAVIREGALA